MCGSARPGFAAGINKSGSNDTHRSNDNNNYMSSSSGTTPSVLSSDGVQMVMRPQSVYAPTNINTNNNTNTTTSSHLMPRNTTNANSSYSRTPFTTD